jgi:hypothetical protein
MVTTILYAAMPAGSSPAGLAAPAACSSVAHLALAASSQLHLQGEQHPAFEVLVAIHLRFLKRLSL